MSRPLKGPSYKGLGAYLSLPRVVSVITNPSTLTFLQSTVICTGQYHVYSKYTTNNPPCQGQKTNILGAFLVMSPPNMQKSTFIIIYSLIIVLTLTTLESLPLPYTILYNLIFLIPLTNIHIYIVSSVKIVSHRVRFVKPDALRLHGCK